MFHMKMDLFEFPASLILLLSFLRIKYKTFHNSIFAVSNNVTVSNSKATVAFLYFLKFYRERT